MAVISASDYVRVAQDIAEGFDSQTVAKEDYYDAVYKVARFDEVIPSVDILPVLYNTYLVATDTLENSSYLLSAVRAINNHVVTESTYNSIDEFLSNNNETVPQTWANLSEQAGFDISSSNIS